MSSTKREKATKNTMVIEYTEEITSQFDTHSFDTFLFDVYQCQLSALGKLHDKPHMVVSWNPASQSSC